MPIDLKIYPKEHILQTVWVSPVTMQDSAEVLAASLSHPEFIPGINYLADIRKSDHQFTFAEVREMSSWIRGHNEKFVGSHWAIVCQEPMQTALSILFKEASENTPIKINIFYEMENALEWLELCGSKVDCMNFN